jgi:hypothetical protein
MALVLESIFKTKNPYGVAGLGRESYYKPVQIPRELNDVFKVLLTLLGTLEIGRRNIAFRRLELILVSVVNKCKRRHKYIVGCGLHLSLNL